MLSVAVGEGRNVVLTRRVRLCATCRHTALDTSLRVRRNWFTAAPPRLHRLKIVRCRYVERLRLTTTSRRSSRLTESRVARNVSSSFAAISRRSSTSVAGHVEHPSSERSFGAAQEGTENRNGWFEGRSRFENPRDGLRLLEATAANATSRSTAVRHPALRTRSHRRWAGHPMRSARLLVTSGCGQRHKERHHAPAARSRVNTLSDRG